MSKKNKHINKTSNKENISVNTKYSWKFWCIVIVEITLLVTIILWLFLSIKAIVQDIQMLYFENKVKGTVTVTEYDGAEIVYDPYNSVDSTKYDHVHYVIKFDNSESGYSQYEFHADDIISSRKYEGQRFLVLFNEIDNPTLIRLDAITTDNLFLISFIFLCTIIVIFRKNLYLWIKRIGDKLQNYI